MIASKYQKLTGYSKFSIFRSLDTQVSVRTRMTVASCVLLSGSHVRYNSTKFSTVHSNMYARTVSYGVALSLDPAVTACEDAVVLHGVLH